MFSRLLPEAGWLAQRHATDTEATGAPRPFCSRLARFWRGCRNLFGWVGGVGSDPRLTVELNQSPRQPGDVKTTLETGGGQGQWVAKARLAAETARALLRQMLGMMW